MRRNLNSDGRLGCVIPSGIASDDTTKYFFQDLIDSQSLISLYDFENCNLFPGVHSRYKFCLLTCGSGAKPAAERASFVFFAKQPEDMQVNARRFSLSRAEIALFNPNTKTCPIFASGRDAVLTRAIYRRQPVLWRANSGNRQEKIHGILSLPPCLI